MNIKTFTIFLFGGIFISLPFILSVPGVYWDDAYIFFRYAENIVNGLGFVYNPGEPYLGVTSILWTLIISIIRYLFGDELPFISKIVGIIFYSMAAGVWVKIVIAETHRFWYGICSGIMIITNPLGVLLAISGMDTALSIFIFSWCIYVLYFYKFKYPIYIGTLLGLYFLTRPDALIFIVIFIFIFIQNFYNEIKKKHLKIFSKLLTIFSTAVIISLPCIIYLFYTTGYFIPPTLIGKLLERLPSEHGITYLQFLNMNIIASIELTFKNILALFGVKRGGIVVLPFCLLFLLGVPIGILFKRVRHYFFRKDNLFLPLFFYSLSLLLVFSFKFPLPMPRYVANLIPVSIVGSFLIGNILLINVEKIYIKFRMFSKEHIIFLVISFIVLNISLLLMALPNYVTHAKEQQIRHSIGIWLNENTPKESVLVLEPIGEIGYYSKRKIVDLGGLVNKSVWKYIEYGYEDADKMFEFIQKNKVDYLVDRPPEISWSINNTVRKYKSHFSLQKTFGTDLNSYYIYKVNL